MAARVFHRCKQAFPELSLSSLALVLLFALFFFSDSFSQVKKENKLATPFIIGGATLYNKMFELDKISKVHLSLLNKESEYECDTFFDMKHLCDANFRVNKIQTFLWDKEKPINYNRSVEKWPRTQTLPELFEINSGFFINSRENYLKYEDRIEFLNDYLKRGKI